MTPFPALLNRLIEGHHLEYGQMMALMRAIMGGMLTPIQIAAVLVALRCKGETVDEIAAAATVMRELSIRVSLADQPDLVDTCGTGGDATHTFNISTAAAIVAAAAGVKVAKHCGRSVSSTSGSADVLEALGVNVQLDPEQVSRCVRDIGIGFMFAPNHHSAMKFAAPVRRELGIRTLFNLLGPLTNPAGAANQVIGVYAANLTGPLALALHQLGSRHVLVVHGTDGMDELSLSGESQIAELQAGVVREYTVYPEQFGLQRAEIAALRVGNLEAATDLLQRAITGQHRAASDVVALNAGAAIYVSGMVASLNAGVQLAAQHIASGAAQRKLEQLIAYSHV